MSDATGWQTSDEKEKPAKKVIIDPTVAAVVEGFRGLVDELKQSRVEAPDVHAKAMKKAMRPSNDRVPEISAFNPRGQKDYPLPDLKCEIHAPYIIHPAYHGLDREELELFNLLQPGEYEIELVDGSRGRIFVKGLTNEITGKLEKLMLDTSPRWTAENKNLFPATRVMLREMLGDAALEVMTMKDELAGIKAGKILVSVGE